MLQWSDIEDSEKLVGANSWEEEDMCKILNQYLEN